MRYFTSNLVVLVILCYSRILRTHYLVDLHFLFPLSRKSVPFDIPFRSIPFLPNEYDGNCVARIDRASDQTDISNPRKLTDNGTQRSAVATTVVGYRWQRPCSGVVELQKATPNDRAVTSGREFANNYRAGDTRLLCTFPSGKASLASIKANTKGR